MKRYILWVIPILLIFQCITAEGFAYQENIVQQESSITTETVLNLETKEITIQGVINSDLQDLQVAVIVSDPEGNICYIHQKPMNADGSYSFSFQMSDNALEGMYNISVGAKGIGKSQETQFFYKSEIEKYLLTVKAAVDASTRDVSVWGNIISKTGETQGDYKFMYCLPSDASSGVYEVIVDGPNIEETGFAEFTYVSIPDEEPDYTITVQAIPDDKGNVSINGSLLSLTGETLGQYQFNYQLPNDATSGTYEVVVDTLNAIQETSTTFIYNRTGDSVDQEDDADHNRPLKPSEKTIQSIRQLLKNASNLSNEQLASKLHSILEDLYTLAHSEMDIITKQGNSKVTISNKLIQEKLQVIQTVKSYLEKEGYKSEDLLDNEISIHVTKLPLQFETEISIPVKAIEGLRKEGINIRIQDSNKTFIVHTQDLYLQGEYVHMKIQSEKNKIVEELEKALKNKNNAYEELRLITEGLQWQVSTIESSNVAEDSIRNMMGSITWSYDSVKKNINVDKLGIYGYSSESQQWHYIQGDVDKEKQTITFEADGSEVYILMEYNKTFKDIQGHWAQEDLEYMASKHIVQGTGDNSLAPDQQITRAEFVSLLIRALGFDGESYNNHFKDVSSHVWYADNLQTAVQAGLLSGYDGYIRPEDFITREEMAALIVRAYEQTKLNISSDLEVKNIDIFNDKGDISFWALSYMKKALQLGVMQGVDKMHLAPQANATRAQAIVMLKRALGN